jgi:hypothetical protein
MGGKLDMSERGAQLFQMADGQGSKLITKRCLAEVTPVDGHDQQHTGSGEQNP